MSLKNIQNQLIDPYGRVIHKLRVQLIDACNFRCFYCMPSNAKFFRPSELLTASELLHICSGLVDSGIDEIRISGGEPTIRKDFEEIVAGLSSLDLLKLGVTTNAVTLKSKLPFLKSTQCRYINISLDSLTKRGFYAITKTDEFHVAYDAILKAKQMGFHVKVNVVLLKGVNDHEIFDFIDFSAKQKIEVRFLELMKIGLHHDQHAKLFISAQEIIERIELRDKLTPQSMNCDSTSFNFRTLAGAQIGFIASESQPFCCFCSRLRLTAQGVLRACLMVKKGINFRDKEKSEYPKLLQSVIAMKPTDRINSIAQPMYQIGG
ncbi:MAG: radical SAM protein [Candidatus Omnitrophica bacterium]|nr:radical SAM protein [Candidatus Omnitrophota bacterium]